MEIRLHSKLALGVLAGMVAFSVPLVLGFLGAVHPAFDSLGHFRAHLAVAMGFCALLLLAFSGFRREAAAALVLAFGAVATTLEPDWNSAFAAGDSSAERAGEGAIYRLLHLNLRFNNAEPEQFFALVGRHEPDVLTLNEVSAMWRGKLALLEAAYPHRIVCDAASVIGSVAILSRYPFAPDRKPACFDRGSLAIARIDLGGRRLDVAALHLHWPWPYSQAAHIGSLRGGLASLGELAVLAGDFNATSWSAGVESIADAGGLARVPGSGRTWIHRTLPKTLRRVAGLPIDHVLAKGSVRAEKLEALGDTGSDHLPLLLIFSIEDTSEAEEQQALVAAPPQAFSPASSSAR